MTKVITVRINEMLKDPAINKIYQDKKTESEAKEWIVGQAIITLMYSADERAEMLNGAKS